MYEHMSPTCRWIALGVLLGLFLLTGRLTSAGPKAAGISLFRFELCATTERAQQLLQEWSGKLGVLRKSTLWDFVFILSYTPLLMLLCAAAARGYQSTGGAFGMAMYWLGLPLCWAIIVAGACDMIENVGMLQVIAKNGLQPWPAITSTFSAVKWCITTFGATYSLVGLVLAGVHLWRT